MKTLALSEVISQQGPFASSLEHDPSGLGMNVVDPSFPGTTRIVASIESS